MYRASWTAGTSVKPKGAPDRVERQTMDEKKGRWLMRSIPVLCLVAGAAFGRAVAPYSPLSPWLTAVLSAAVWLLLGWNYVHTFARDVAHRGEQWSIRGDAAKSEIPQRRTGSIQTGRHGWWVPSIILVLSLSGGRRHHRRGTLGTPPGIPVLRVRHGVLVHKYPGACHPAGDHRSVHRPADGGIQFSPIWSPSSGWSLP